MPLWIPFAWYGLGLIGCALLWWERTCWFRGSDGFSFLCPTPKVIVLSAVFAFCGIIPFLVGIIIVATSGDIGRDTWWNTPICKRELR